MLRTSGNWASMERASSPAARSCQPQSARTGRRRGCRARGARLQAASESDAPWTAPDGRGSSRRHRRRRGRRCMKRRRLRWVLRGVAAFLVLLVLVVLGGLIWLHGSLPQVDGRIVLKGLDAPVTVRRDADGVPTIRAQSDTDAAFALGFVHAQDRLFQMEMMRRIGAGRLSEVARRAHRRARPPHAHARPLPPGRGQPGASGARCARRAGRLQRRRQRLPGAPQRRAAAGVRADARHAGAWRPATRWSGAG